jgi:P4 family phage/plasmid primase-like protien
VFKSGRSAKQGAASKLTTVHQLPHLVDYNRWADFWRNNIGVNVIPADTKNKKTGVNWGEYQENPIPTELHDKWKSQHSFSYGMDGRIWHREDRIGYYLIGVDADNLRAIEEICNRNGKATTLQKVAASTMVEQHEDNPNKAHLYFYSPRPLFKKSSDITVQTQKIMANEVPAIEVKSSGGNGIMFCTPSLHKSGYRYTIIGIPEPVMLNIRQANELEQHIDKICRKYDLKYLDNGKASIAGYSVSIQDLFKADTKILEGHNRHEALLRAMESLIMRNRNILPLDKIKDFAHEWNNAHCSPPLGDKDLEKQWKSATKFIARRTMDQAEQDSADQILNEYSQNSIQHLAVKVMETHALKTVMDTEEIYHYTGGIYRTGGEQIIKITLEEIAGYSINGHKRREIVDHIKYRTMIEREIFDCDPNILNVKNGLLDMSTGARTDHNSQFLSLVQLPVAYDKKAKCPNIMQFLAQVLHPRDVFTALQIIGYCLYKSSKYEKAIMLFGGGSNGKGLFIKLIEALVGLENTSHVPLQDIDSDRFAAADMFGKIVNTFADLKQEKMSGTGIFKALVSGDSIRAQKKYGQPFSYRNYAVQIFSTNKIPESDDRSYAYYRRWVILCFDKVYEGKNKDTDLIDKLTTQEELSGLLNLALIALRQLHRDGGFKDVTVERVKKEYDSKANIILAFLKEECVVDLTTPEYYALTTDVYSAYVSFCHTRGEKPLEPNVFGKKLAEQGIERERSRYHGDRDYYYLGLKIRADLRGVNQPLN